jgi:hypothetical protein
MAKLTKGEKNVRRAGWELFLERNAIKIMSVYFNLPNFQSGRM